MRNQTTVTLCRHEDGRPVAMIPATGKKEDCEVSEARTLLADPNVLLENALVTADPLHNKEPTLCQRVEKLLLKSSLAEAASLPLAHEARAAGWMGLRGPGLGKANAENLEN